MKKTKVLFFIDSLICGGAEKSLISLLPLLDFSKIEVDLMMVKRGGVFERYIPKQVNVIRFPTPKGMWFQLCQLAFRLLLRICKNRHGAELRWMAMSSAYKPLSQQYDVAFAYQQGFPTYYVADKVQANKKYAWINADIMKAGYREEFNRPFYDTMTRVVPVSDVLCEMLKKTSFASKDKLFTVYDILNVDLIKQMAVQPVPLTSSQLKRWRIVTVGRMVEPKGYDLAVAAAKLLADHNILFDWYFVGDGGMRPEIEQLTIEKGLQENIHFVGMTPNPYPYMAAADIYVQTSRFEGFGLTLNEARILNCPVISTNFPVVYNQITDGENGLICEMTPESIAEKILLLVHDANLRNKLIEGTKKEVNTTVQTEPAKVMQLILR